MIIKIGSNWLFNKHATSLDTPDWHTFNFWLFIEFAFFNAYIATNAVFLFIRGLVDTEYYLEAPNAFKSQISDFLDANNILVGVISLMSSPAFVAACIWAYSKHITILSEDES